MLHLPVFLEDLQALLTIHFQHVSPKLVPSAEQFVELPIPEADDAVILDGAPVVGAAAT